MSIIGGMLVRNEADRYLKDMCHQMDVICDRVIVVDDCSTDDTVKICREAGFDVLESQKSLWTTDEVRQRKRLFNMMTAKANHGDWLLILDADERILSDLIRFRGELIDAQATSMCYRLYDIWSIFKCQSSFSSVRIAKYNRNNHLFDTNNLSIPDVSALTVPVYDGRAYLYRNDQYWTAHNGYWPMAYRYIPNNFIWNEQALHCGRFPINMQGLPMPSKYKIAHLGWATEEDRKIKYERYMKADPKGEYGILAQYESILDNNPVLEAFSIDD